VYQYEEDRALGQRHRAGICDACVGADPAGPAQLEVPLRIHAVVQHADYGDPVGGDAK
jgi:hypothetical protein